MSGSAEQRLRSTGCPHMFAKETRPEKRLMRALPIMVLALVFLAALFGLIGIAGAVSNIAMILFVGFLVLAAAAFLRRTA